MADLSHSTKSSRNDALQGMLASFFPLENPNVNSYIAYSKGKKFKPRKHTIRLLSVAMIHECSCCPFITGAVDDFREAKRIIDALLPDHPSIISSGMIGNIDTWEELFRHPTDMDARMFGMEHCFARMGAIEKLWGEHLSKESIDTSMKFLANVMVTLPFLQHPRFTAKPKLRGELWALAFEVLAAISTHRKESSILTEDARAAFEAAEVLRSSN